MSLRVKKIFAITLTLCMAFVLMLSTVGCGTDDGDNIGGENAELVAGDLGGTGDEKPDTQAEPPAPNDRIQKLSVEIFRQAASTDRSSMVSPISVIMAMSMVENGAEGETKAQMEKAFGMKSGEMSEWLKAWRESQAADEKTLNIANSLWYNESLGFEPSEEYKRLLTKSFAAEINGGSFDSSTVKSINAWVKKESKGMIEKITNRLSAEDVLLLLNAIAFDDKWSEPYEEYRIKTEAFTKEDGSKSELRLMYSEESSYLHDELATGFIKPYESGYSFAAILPNEGVSVKEYLSKTDAESFTAFLNSSENAVVHAVLPEFKSEYETSAAVEIFKKMGITRLFDSSAAELGGMGNRDDIFVSGITHKTYIDVNSEGTRAAAVTGVMCGTTSLAEPQQEYTVRLDRPFIYAIIDADTATPVFMGTMMGE